VQGTKTFEEGKWRNSGEMVVEKRALENILSDGGATPQCRNPAVAGLKSTCFKSTAKGREVTRGGGRGGDLMRII